MGWFDEQIRQRIQMDDEAFSEAFVGMADIIMGQRLAQLLQNDRIKTKNAIEEILKYYHIMPGDIPDHVKTTEDQLEYLMRPHGIMWRTVNLEGEWYKDAVGPMLGSLSQGGGAVALIPKGFSGYEFFDTASGKKVRLGKKTASLLDPQAICFYKPFPLKEIGIGELVKYIAQTVRGWDYALVAAATLAATLVGLLPPYINNIIYSRVIATDSVRLLLAIFIFYLSAALAQVLIGSYRSMALSRLTSKLSVTFQAAGMARLLSLPAGFFKNYSAGELSGRMNHIGMLCSTIVNSFLSVGLTFLFSFVYITQMVRYGSGLVIPAVGVILVTALVSLFSMITQLKLSRARMELAARESGITYSLVSGVQKIKLAGAEKRAFAKWAQTYIPLARLSYDSPVSVKVSAVLSQCIFLIGTLVIYYFAVRTGIGIADYYAFQSAYGMVMGAFVSLTGIVSTFSQIRPMLEMIEPLLKAVPEISENKRMVEKLSGGIELNGVTFRYTEDMPPVIDDLSLKIRPGQYVAIVGRTGCGKSTLMRLLLGFEKQEKGAIYYDGKDIENLDLKSLRRRIGVVMQDGKLFSGDIYSNITISAPWLTLKQAWEAAELAGIAEDIRNMPMGMHTVISEGSGGVSGGQKQRLLIARAVASLPKVLMLDEATSALDNLTQKKVSDSLNRLKCTRIIIAHRLSTIRQCDRILVLDKGRIAEDGTYEQLLAQNGIFAELVAKQRLDDAAYVDKTALY